MHLVQATCVCLVICLSAAASQITVFERGNGRNRQTPRTPNLGKSNRNASTRRTATKSSEEIDSAPNFGINRRKPNAGQHHGTHINDSLPQNDSNESISIESTTKESISLQGEDDTITTDAASPFSNDFTELPANLDTDFPVVNVPKKEFTTRPSIRPNDIWEIAKNLMNRFAATSTTSRVDMAEESWTSDGTLEPTTYLVSIDESSKYTAPSTDQSTNFDPSYESEISTIQSTDQTTYYGSNYESVESSTTSTDQTDDPSPVFSRVTTIHLSPSTTLPITASTRGVSSASVSVNDLPSTMLIDNTSSETSTIISLQETGNYHPNSAETVEEALELVTIPYGGLLATTVDQIPDFDSHVSSDGGTEATISADFCPAADSVTSGQCPCMTANGKTSCVAYDSTYQAVSLEEAVLNFKDTTDPNPLTARTLAPASNVLDKNGFTSLCPKGNSLCKRCVRKIYEQLADQVASFSDSSLRNETMGELRSMLRDSRANAAGLGDNCPSINIQTTARRFRIANDPLQVENCLRGGSGSSSANNVVHTGGATGLDNSDNSDSLWNNFPSSRADAGRNIRGQRSKREARDIEGQLTARCETRGQPVKSGEPWVGLCNVCWKWGVLRSDLYPRYINIMTCDSDIKCLSGYGECRQRYRNYQVLRKEGSKYVKYSVNAPFACECQVRSGSALHAFVSK